MTTTASMYRIPMDQKQWDTKLRIIAIAKAAEYHRPADLWFLYTPEAVTLMKRTWFLDIPDFDESKMYQSQDEAALIRALLAP